MFDYQAGEKYRLILIMAGLSGLMAGILLTTFIAPCQPPARQAAAAQHLNHPDVTGHLPAATAGGAYAGGGAAASGPPASAIAYCDPLAAQGLIEEWIRLAWDLSAGSASRSQERAMEYMTPDCAAAYRRNIWTPALAAQIEESQLASSFVAERIQVGSRSADGSVVVLVEGVQTLAVAGRGSSARRVKLEYLVRQTGEGMRIAGISEGSQTG